MPRLQVLNHSEEAAIIMPSLLPSHNMLHKVAEAADIKLAQLLLQVIHQFSPLI